MDEIEIAEIEQIANEYGQHTSVVKRGGVLVGPHVEPRMVAKWGHDAGWRDHNVAKAVAICGGECSFMSGSYNDNLKDGVVVSRDCGDMQINIPASEIGSDYEKRLRGDPEFGVHEAHRLWIAWGGGKVIAADDERAWDHWVAWSSGVARDPNLPYSWMASRAIGNFTSSFLFEIPTVPVLYYEGGKRFPPL